MSNKMSSPAYITRPYKNIVCMDQPDATLNNVYSTFLRHQSASSCRLILPVRRKLLGALVVASQPMDPALYEDEPELGVLVLPVSFQVLPHGNCLLDKVVQILGNFRPQTRMHP
eukprot:TRINITY_DN486_c0_g2_i2.p1 TRINITY_DN486_c0_g2~~TRINITY_DN486_c0_g2_i2.p1  ORF type:complete len:114 (+),score=3.55 TRINITY_DN486_c0_g2_i2:286-627(+)